MGESDEDRHMAITICAMLKKKSLHEVSFAELARSLRDVCMVSMDQTEGDTEIMGGIIYGVKIRLLKFNRKSRRVWVATPVGSAPRSPQMTFKITSKPNDVQKGHQQLYGLLADCAD